MASVLVGGSVVSLLLVAQAPAPTLSATAAAPRANTAATPATTTAWTAPRATPAAPATTTAWTTSSTPATAPVAATAPTPYAATTAGAAPTPTVAPTSAAPTPYVATTAAAATAAAPTPYGAPATVAAPPSVPAPIVTPQQPPDIQPVLRAAPGNWGMTFIFGGFAPLSLGGLGDRQIGQGLLFTEIGVRRVFKRFVLPFSFGAGVSRQQPAGQTTKTTTAGISASIAILKGFRVWRRIAPYFGAFFHTHYIHSGGAGNWLLNLSVGPILGIEYFLADRVSLYGQGIFGIGPDITRGAVSVNASSAIAAGGQLGLTFYF